MPVVTEFGGKLLIVGPTKAGKELTVLDVPALSTKSLSELLVGPKDAPNTGWIGAYFVNYLDGADAERRWPEWIAGIDSIGPELWRLFGGRLDFSSEETRGQRPYAARVAAVGLARHPASWSCSGSGQHAPVYGRLHDRLCAKPRGAHCGR